ncbi:MAG: glycosyltransferase family 2 protein [Planctomycetota bacterium]
MSERFSIGGVVPAYQAAATLRDVVERTRRAVDRLIVVDDGSTDGTRAALAGIDVEVITHDRNRGKGAALRTGMAVLFAEGFDYVATIDADGQHLPEELFHLKERLVDAPDLVLGVRNHLFASMGAARRTSNRVSSRIISYVAGESFADIQTGFRLYGRRLFHEVGLPEDGFDAESAVIVRACRRGYRVTTTPVAMAEVDGRATSHFRPLLDSLRIARAVLGARLERVR